MRSEGKKDSGEQKRTIRVERRRKTEPSETPRKRAEAPARQRPSSQAPASRPAGTAGTAQRPTGTFRPTTIGASGQTSGIKIPGGGLTTLLMVGLLVVAVVCYVAFTLLGGGGDREDTGLGAPPAVTQPPAVVQPTMVPATPRPTGTRSPFLAPVSSGDQTWLIMLYQDADDKILEQDILLDLNEAELVGSTDRVQIVAQVDRFQGGYQGDGNWTSAKRFHITRDDDLKRVSSPVLQELGEVNMADSQTLTDFVTWAARQFPADKLVLILSDHGMGWPGGWSDPDPAAQGDPSIPLTARLGNHLYLHELDQALGAIRSQLGLDRFELIGMDACLMGHLEVMAALEPHARYAVASQETEPAVGWAYTSFLQTLVDNPAIDGAELGRVIVDSYIREDQRIVDDQARAEMTSRGSPLGGLFSLSSGGVSADQLVQQMARNTTLSAVDLASIPDLLNSLNELAYVLQSADQQVVAKARSNALSFTNVFGSQVPASYIDLGNWVQLLQRESRDSAVRQAADQVLQSLNQAVVAEKHGQNRAGATGLSIYFPNSQLFSSPLTGLQSYATIASQFATTTLWDDLLTFHYGGRKFERAPAVPIAQVPTSVTAPGAGKITLSEVTASDRLATPGRPILLSTDVSGENIGHIYLFAGYHDQAANSIWIADTDYLESRETREVDGVYYPDWGEGEFTLEFEWEPLVYGITDGSKTAVALLQPDKYGASAEDTTYTVEGIFTYADSGDTRYARLYFRDGYLRHVYGFTGEDGTGSPREIIPSSGDSITILEKWMDLDSSGRAVATTTQPGGTLTFGDQMFAWEVLDAPAGEYVVGFIATDLDGNTTQAYQQITVR
jgi:hypothetical protein